MKPFIIRFVIFSVAAYLVAVVSGGFSSQLYNVSVSEEETAAALKRTLGAEMTPTPDFSFTRGETHQGWMVRRSLLHGLPAVSQPMSMIEQSIQVGWPLTIVQGSIHQNGPEKHVHGVFLMSDRIEPPYNRVFPYQPSWLGVLVWGLIGAATVFIRKKK